MTKQKAGRANDLGRRQDPPGPRPSAAKPAAPQAAPVITAAHCLPSTSNGLPSPRSKLQSVFLGLILVLAILGAYQAVWHAGFIWDDDAYVTRNELLTAPDGLWRIWFSADSPSQYFPLVYTVFRLERSLWG